VRTNSRTDKRKKGTNKGMGRSKKWRESVGIAKRDERFTNYVDLDEINLI